MNYSELFQLGMKRQINEPLDMPDGIQYNLGAGAHYISGAIELDWPGWDGDHDPIPRDDGEVAGIHAYHFLEHLEDPINMLRECERVLMVGGIMNIVVPFGACSMALHDLDHKHLFNEDTWKTLFKTAYYDKFGTWEFTVHLNIVMGIDSKNLALFTQLIRR